MTTLKINEQQKEWAIKAAAGIAMIVLCYTFMIHPVFTEITTLRQGIEDSHARIELFRDVKSLRVSLGDLEKDLANLTDRSLLLGQLSDIAGQTQVDFETLTPRTEPEGPYTRLKIETEGKGSFFSLLNFLETVEKINAAFRIREISLLDKLFDDASKNKDSLQIHLVFETFLKSRGKKNNA